MIIFMELFLQRSCFIPLYLLLLLSLVINVHRSEVKVIPKNTNQIIGQEFLFGLSFDGDDATNVETYAFVNVSVPRDRGSKIEGFTVVYSFPILKKVGKINGKIWKSHMYYGKIRNITTIKTSTYQSFTMTMTMICRMSTNFHFYLVKASKEYDLIKQQLFTSYQMVSLDDDTKLPTYYPGDAFDAVCSINKCNKLDSDRSKLRYDNFLLTSKQFANESGPSTNVSAIAISEHDNVLGTNFRFTKDFTITCNAFKVSCALNQKTWKKRMILDPNATLNPFCVSKNLAFMVKHSDGNVTNNLKYIADNAVFKTICVAFTNTKEKRIFTRGRPATITDTLRLSKRTQNPKEIVLTQITTFRYDDFFCYYPRKTFHCFLNGSATKSAIIPFRPTECEPQIISFKSFELSSDEAAVTCIIRKPIGEKIEIYGIVDDDKAINVSRSWNSKTDKKYKRNRNALVLKSTVPFSTCPDLKDRNITCWFSYESETFFKKLDSSLICEKEFNYALLWLLLLLLIPILILLCCLCASCCRRCCRRTKDRFLKFVEKKTKSSKAALVDKEDKRERERDRIKSMELIKPPEMKRIESKRMYRMFKKRRPFGWRELNDHFLWLSIMAQEEQRTRSLSPSHREYAHFRVLKKRMRFGNRELISYSQTLLHQGARTEEDLATLRDLETYCGNLSQLTMSQEISKLRDDSIGAHTPTTQARMEQMLSDMYSEGAIGNYSQLENFQEIPDAEAQDKETESSSSDTSDTSESGNKSKRDSKTNNNQRASARRQKRKKLRRLDFDNIA